MRQSDTWFVQLTDGNVHRVTLDQLDEAFQAGQVDSETLVLAQGTRNWARLGELAGLDEAPAPAFEPGFGASGRAPQRNAPSVVVNSASFPPSYYAPVWTSGRPATTNSVRPVSVDLTDEFENVSFRGGSGRVLKRLGSVVTVLAALGAVAFVGVSRPPWARPVVARAESYLARVGVHLPSSQPPVLAAATPPPVAEPVPVVAPAPAPTTATAAVWQPAEQQTASAVTSWVAAPPVKATPPEAKREVRTRSHQQIHFHPARAAEVRSSGFTTSGNKYDPLNSTITP
jgi:hypothetical protein